MNHRIARSPHDQHRARWRQLVSVATVDQLPAGVDDERSVARHAARRSPSASDADPRVTSATSAVDRNPTARRPRASERACSIMVLGSTTTF